MKNFIKEKILVNLSLMVSFSTLFCCALPALLVSLGLGATMLTLTQLVPQLIWLGENKNSLFAISFMLVFLSHVLVIKQKNAPCPVDPNLRQACITGRKWSMRFVIVSWIVWMVGAFFSYLAVYLIQ